MSRNYKSFNNRRNNDLYVPPFRKYQTGGDFGPPYSNRRYDNAGGGPSGGGGQGGGGPYNSGGKRYEGNRGDYHQKGGGGTRFDPYKGPRGPRGGRNNRKHKNRNTDRQNYDINQLDHLWFKIQVPFGKKFGKEFIVSSINGILDVPFNPIGFQTDGNAALFYVDSGETAQAIRAKNRCIQTPEGGKMNLVVGRSPPPNIHLSAEVIEKLKVAMSNRFNPETNILSLNSFHKDADLRRDGIYLPLNRNAVFDAVVKVINENIPQLIGLDLSSNRINNLNILSSILSLKNLKSLSLKNNQILRASDLHHLKGLEIEELILDENPICDQFKDQTSYISAIRDKFPKVVKLDGQDLPPPIIFDLGTEIALPPKKGSFFPSDDTRQIIVLFLESFFQIYDSPSRQGLLDAYHNDAVYSVSTYKPRSQATPNFYTTMGRNLLARNEDGQRNNLKEGKLEIVAFLNRLPQSNHDPKSMTVDVAHVSETLMMFNVMGVFKEVSSEDSGNPLKNFSRSFAVVPSVDKRITIVNDIHFVGNANTEQIKAFKAAASKEVIEPIVDKNKLALQVSEMTGMNLPFSVRCLEENNWDLNNSLLVFNQLKADGRIPPEAFVK